MPPNLCQCSQVLRPREGLSVALRTPPRPPPGPAPLTKLGGSGLGSMWPLDPKAQKAAPRTEEGAGPWSEAQAALCN